MAFAEWCERIRRTGYYDTIDHHDGMPQKLAVPVYKVDIAGGPGGYFLEPADCLNRADVGVGSTANSSGLPDVKRVHRVAPVRDLYPMLEDNNNGPDDPVPLHSIGFGWPL